MAFSSGSVRFARFESERIENCFVYKQSLGSRARERDFRCQTNSDEVKIAFDCFPDSLNCQLEPLSMPHLQLFCSPSEAAEGNELRPENRDSKFFALSRVNFVFVFLLGAG